MSRKICIESLWKIEAKTASHQYHARGKTLFAESSTVSDSSDAEFGIAGIQAFYTQTLVRVTLTLAGQDPDILLNYCNIEDISGNTSTQLKVPVLILNPTEEVIVQKIGWI